MLRARMAVLFIGAMALWGCGDSNPLIGEWKAEDPAGGSAEVLSLVFTKETMSMMGMTKKVTYDIKGSDTVVVKPEGEETLTMQVVDHEGKSCLKTGLDEMGLWFCKV